MISWLVDGLFAALVALLVASGLAGQSGVGQVAVVAASTATAVPAPAGSDAADVGAYLAAIHPALDDLGAGIGTMVDLMGAPDIASGDWRDQSAAAFATVQAAHAALQAADVPADLVEVHTLLTDATQYCADGAAVAGQAIDAGQPAGIYAATPLVTKCAAGIREWRAALEGLGGLGE